MKPSEQMTSDQPNVLPWHREAAKETYNHIGDWAYESGVEPIAAIIARRDPHAETLRLLEEAMVALARSDSSGEYGPLLIIIRAHLAAHSKPDAKQKGSQ